MSSIRLEINLEINKGTFHEFSAILPSRLNQTSSVISTC